MMDALYRPLKWETVLLVSVALIAANAVYCLAYNDLAGRSEGVGAAIAWGVVNLLPWYLAFEAGKRLAALRAAIAVLATALGVSLLLHVLLYGPPVAPAFELLRRLPGLLLVGSLLAGRRLLVARRNPAATLSLPMPPHAIDWVSAAGNYVELHGANRTILHRAPLGQVQSELERHGFVRIHRSILVRRERIARIRPHDVVLHDGTSLKTGKRYRSILH